MNDLILNFLNGVPESGLFIDVNVHNNEQDHDDGVTHSRWFETYDLNGEYYLECLNCGLLWSLDHGNAKENQMFFCPRCGAKMDADEEDEPEEPEEETEEYEDDE